MNTCHTCSALVLVLRGCIAKPTRQFLLRSVEVQALYNELQQKDLTCGETPCHWLPATIIVVLLASFVAKGSGNADYNCDDNNQCNLEAVCYL
jgi:hypothetical protein